jgi:hypothetical protein
MSSSSFTKFWGCAFALSSYEATGFSPESAIANGLLNSTSGPLITALVLQAVYTLLQRLICLAFRMSQHHYSGAEFIQDLMAPSNIRSNITVFATDIADVHAKGLK